MNNEQYKRYRKMNSDPISHLCHLQDKQGNLHFLISGSTAKRYRVSIYVQTGKIYCTCPDNKHTGKVQECICKHCLFVIFKVLKIFNDLNHTFFTRRWFTADEISTAKGIYKTLKQPNRAKN